MQVLASQPVLPTPLLTPRSAGWRPTQPQPTLLPSSAPSRALAGSHSPSQRRGLLSYGSVLFGLESQEATCSVFTSLTPSSQGLLQRYLMEPKGPPKGQDMAHSLFSLGLGEIDLLW